MIAERLLGFDVREWDSQADGLWDGARRELFLLRLDVLRPLSADRLVWPSVFGSTPSDDWARPGRQGIPLPQYTGPNTGLWEDAAAMLHYLRANWTQPRPYAVLACTWLSDNGFLEAGSYGPHLEPTRPAAVDPTWRRLGFDVGDSGLLSGVSNCGYMPEEAAALRPAWGMLLNACHLFDEPAHAFAFRSVADVRVPEHAPFFVYGLYLLEVDQGANPWHS